jgi:diketogulonate reductase-like aldo/keto reductase
VLYHLEERDLEHVLLPVCERLGVAVVGYSPFASGDFVDPRGAGASALRELGERYFVSPRAIALAYLVRRPSLFAIPKAIAPKHVEDNARAGSLTLTDDDIARIEREFPLEAPRSSLPTF